jgi:hypothetical protein
MNPPSHTTDDQRHKMASSAPSSADTKSGDALMIPLHEASSVKIDAILAQLDQTKQTPEQLSWPFADGCASTIKHSS